MAGSMTLSELAAEALPRPALLCTLVKVTGSAPQVPGAKMWVTAREFRGTLGGGELERLVLVQARELLAQPAPAPLLKDYTLCKELGQCCGGRVEVFFEPVPKRRTVHLFGAGHVGRAAASVLAGMPFDLHLIDSRPEWARAEGLPAEARVFLEDPLAYAKSRSWDASDAVCIFTHSHTLDFLLTKHFLKLDLGYLGLIGSRHKARVFEARLQALAPQDPGLLELWEEKMHCPIGLPLASKNPKIIAVSIAGQLLAEWALNAAPAEAVRG